MAALGTAAGLGTVDLVGIEPQLWHGLGPTAIAILGLVAAIATPPSRTHREVGSRVLLWIGAWVAWSLVSAIGSPEPLLAITVSTAFATTFVAAAGLARRVDTSAIVIVAGVAAIVHAVSAVVLALVGDVDEYPNRLALVELEPNHLAGFLAIVVLVAVLWALDHSMRRWLPVLALSAVCLLGILLTGSRTASLALVASGLFGLVAARRWNWLVVATVGLAGVALFVLTTGSGRQIVSLTNRTSTELAAVDGATGRTTLWRELVDVVEERPVTGIGLGADRNRMLELNDEAGFTWEPQHAHNLLLHLALTTGWVGAVVMGAGLVLGWGEAAVRGSPWVAAVTTFVLIDGISEPVFRLPQLSWIVLVMAVSMTLGPSPPSPGAPGPALGRVAIAGAVSLSIAIGLVWIEPGGYPNRFRCRNDAPFDGGGLVVDIDGTTARIRTTRETVALEAARAEGGFVFDDATPLRLLPSSTARSVRCGALRAGSITVEASVSVDDLAATGPGRIVTISSGPDWNDIDLQLGQEADGLSVRVRESEFRRVDRVVPGAFLDLARHEFVVAIEARRIRVWRDGALIADWSDFLPIEFDTWPVDRPAAFGNEVTEDRPFRGTIASVRIVEGIAVEGLDVD